MVTKLTVELMTHLPELSVILSMVFITKLVKQIIIDHLIHPMGPIKMIVSVGINLIITQAYIECHSRKTMVMCIAQMVTDLQVMDCLGLRTETRLTMRGNLMWPLTGMTVKKEVCDFQEAMSTTVIIQIMTELKKRFAVLWGTCMSLRGIIPRSIGMVAAQEMLYSIILTGIWSNCHAGSVRDTVMEAVTGATGVEVMVMGTNTAEVLQRIAAAPPVRQMSVTVMKRHTTSISQLNWKTGFRNVVVTQELKLTIHLLQWQDQEPYL
jgi:hypothetical protein